MNSRIRVLAGASSCPCNEIDGNDNSNSSHAPFEVDTPVDNGREKKNCGNKLQYYNTIPPVVTYYMQTLAEDFTYL